MSDTNVSDYQKGLVSLSDTVGKTLVAAVRSREEHTEVRELEDASTRLKAELDLISNTLGTIMNWIRLQETALAALSSLQEWSAVAATESDLDAIRHRMRIMIQPQIESFVQSISSADKASRIALPFMSEDLTKIPSLIKRISDINLHMLELIEYEPSTKTSLLDSGINALYRGAIEDFQTKLERLEKNSDIMDQQIEK